MQLFEGIGRQPVLAALLATSSAVALTVWAQAPSSKPVLPGFVNPTPETQRTVSIPTIDISGERHRQTVVAAGTTETYQGHTDTVLLPDGKTMFTAWTIGHARHVGPLARSDDGGRTWSAKLDVPNSWWTTSNTPTIHRLVDPKGVARLIVFAGGLDWDREGKPPYPMHQAISEDDGKTWSEMTRNGVEGEVPPKSVVPFDGGARLVMWTDLPGYVVQSESLDGGLSWRVTRPVLEVPHRWSQPAVLRSPDGRTLLMLLRENSRKHNSLFSVSTDEARTWSEPRELPAELTGDRHQLRYAPDGRLVVVMRDMAKTSHSYGHYVAWVGRFENIVRREPGQYRVKLLHNFMRNSHDLPGMGNSDCGYSDLELLPDGTFVATTYIKYQPGPEKHSVVNVRFLLTETDKLAAVLRRKPSSKRNPH